MEDVRQEDGDRPVASFLQHHLEIFLDQFRLRDDLCGHVDGIADGGVWQQRLHPVHRRLGHRRDIEAMRDGPVRHQDADPPGDAGDSNAAVSGKAAERARVGHVEELVERCRPMHTVLAKHGVEDLVATGEHGGVGCRRAAADPGAADLDDHHRLAVDAGEVERGEELLPVPAALHVTHDDAGGGVGRQIREAVGELDVAFVACRHPAAQPQSAL